jgi:FAD/FMN-containing dehydrogenase
MDKVLEIDEENQTLTVQCGISLGEMAGKVQERGWDVVTADMPVYQDTVGGQLSGYTGGGWSRYGHTVGFNYHYLLGLKVVLPNATVIDTGAGEGGLSIYRGRTWARGVYGPDLTGIFQMDGGIFGIKVEATYRMYRLPKFRKGGLRLFKNLDHAYKVLTELWEIDPYLYMQPYAKAIIYSPEYLLTLGPVTGHKFDPLAEPLWFFYWHHIGNTQEEVDFKNKPIEALCDKYGGQPASPAMLAAVDARCTQENSQQKEIGKHATTGQMLFHEFICSKRDTLEGWKWLREHVLHEVIPWLKSKGVDTSRVVPMGGVMPAGVGVGLIAYSMGYDQNDPNVRKYCHEAWFETIEQGRRRGYLPDVAQNVESKLLAKSWSPEVYTNMLNLKKHMDPNNIMNPGVFFD